MRNNNNVHDKSYTISEQNLLNTWQFVLGVIAAVVTLIVFYSDNNKNNRNKIGASSHSMFTK